MMITAMHATDEAHLADVMESMRMLGAPVIRAAETAYGLVAIEGCHRLEAAYRLGLTPAIKIIENGEIIADHGLQDFDQPMSIEEILEYIEMPEGRTYHFDD